jgi:outer membrane lipoprotein-sorting protein
MRFPSRSRRGPWAVPAGIAVVVAVVSVASSAHADDHPVLAPRTAAELLTSMAGMTPPANLSGTVSETVNLGLPALPSMGDSTGAGTLSLLGLVSGTHQIRVWAAGQDKQRVALLGQLAETDFVHNGADIWTYASAAHEVTHSLAPARGAAPDPLATPPTPQALAAAAVAAVDPSTAVTVDSTARVAGRAAYRLVLTPRDTRTLIASVKVAVDAETSVPLQVQVFAKGHTDAAIDVSFTQISFAAIDASTFAFTPPAGATVTERAAGADGATTKSPNASGQAAPHPTVLGSGWTSVVSLKLPTGAPSPRGTRDATSSASSLLEQMSSPVAGGRVVTTALLTVFLADDGTVYAGAVSPADLQQVATSGRGL